MPLNLWTKHWKKKQAEKGDGISGCNVSSRGNPTVCDPCNPVFDSPGIWMGQEKSTSTPKKSDDLFCGWYSRSDVALHNHTAHSVVFFEESILSPSSTANDSSRQDKNITLVGAQVHRSKVIQGTNYNELHLKDNEEMQATEANATKESTAVSNTPFSKRDDLSKALFMEFQNVVSETHKRQGSIDRMTQTPENFDEDKNVEVVSVANNTTPEDSSNLGSHATPPSLWTNDAHDMLESNDGGDVQNGLFFTKKDQPIVDTSQGSQLLYCSSSKFEFTLPRPFNETYENLKNGLYNSSKIGEILRQDFLLDSEHTEEEKFPQRKDIDINIDSLKRRPHSQNNDDRHNYSEIKCHTFSYKEGIMTPDDLFCHTEISQKGYSIQKRDSLLTSETNTEIPECHQNKTLTKRTEKTTVNTNEYETIDEVTGARSDGPIRQTVDSSHSQVSTSKTRGVFCDVSNKCLENRDLKNDDTAISESKTDTVKQNVKKVCSSRDSNRASYPLPVKHIYGNLPDLMFPCKPNNNKHRSPKKSKNRSEISFCTSLFSPTAKPVKEITFNSIVGSKAKVVITKTRGKSPRAAKAVSPKKTQRRSFSAGRINGLVKSRVQLFEGSEPIQQVSKNVVNSSPAPHDQELPHGITMDRSAPKSQTHHIELKPQTFSRKPTAVPTQTSGPHLHSKPSNTRFIGPSYHDKPTSNHREAIVLSDLPAGGCFGNSKFRRGEVVQILGTWYGGKVRVRKLTNQSRGDTVPRNALFFINGDVSISLSCANWEKRCRPESRRGLERMDRSARIEEWRGQPTAMIEPYIVIHPYVASCPDEATVLRGEVIIVNSAQQIEEDWMWAYVPRTQTFGYLPVFAARPLILQPEQLAGP